MSMSRIRNGCRRRRRAAATSIGEMEPTICETVAPRWNMCTLSDVPDFLAGARADLDRNGEVVRCPVSTPTSVRPKRDGALPRLNAGPDARKWHECLHVVQCHRHFLAMSYVHARMQSVAHG